MCPYGCAGSSPASSTSLRSVLRPDTSAGFALTTATAMQERTSLNEGCPPKCSDEVDDVGGPSRTRKFWYVYVLRSLRNPKETYVGVSRDPKTRINKHNRGENRSTARYRPWEVLSVTRFPSQRKAEDFEKYLKSGSGRAFRKKHLEQGSLRSVLRPDTSASFAPLECGGLTPLWIECRATSETASDPGTPSPLRIQSANKSAHSKDLSLLRWGAVTFCIVGFVGLPDKKLHYFCGEDPETHG